MRKERKLSRTKDYQLNHLLKKRNRMRGVVSTLSRLRTIAGRYIKLHQRRISEVNQRIENITNARRGLLIDDHAILRYMERIKGVDVNALIDEIEADDLKAFRPKSVGKSEFTDSRKIRWRFVDGVIVTAIFDEIDDS